MHDSNLDKLLGKIINPKYLGSVDPDETALLLSILLANFNRDFDHVFAGQLKWFLGLSHEERNRLMKESYFTPVTEFKITVPADYTPAEIWNNQGGRFESYVDSDDFNHPSAMLVPGKKYIVKIARINDDYIVREANDYRGNCEYLIEACLKYMKKDGAILCGIYGLLVAYQQGSDKFSKRYNVLTVDELDHLPILDRGDDSVVHVSDMCTRDEGKKDAIYASFIGDLTWNPHLLYLVEDKE